VLLNIDGPSAVVAEIERQERISEDVIRYLTVPRRRARGSPSGDVAERSIATAIATTARRLSVRPRWGFRGDRRRRWFRAATAMAAASGGDRGPRRRAMTMPCSCD